MFKSIRWKFVIIYIMMVLIVMIFSGTLIIVMLNNSEQELLVEDLHNVIGILEQDIDFNTNVVAIQTELQDRIKIDSGLYIDKKVFVFDEEGMVIFPVNEAIPNNIQNKPQVVAALMGEQLSSLDQNVVLNGESYGYVGYAKAVSNHEDERYVIYALGSKEQIVEKTRSIISIILLTIAVAIVISIALGIVFAGFLSRPLAVLTEKAKEMADGNLDDQAVVRSDDEIGQLTNSFNYMAKSLNDTLGQISSEKNKLEFMFSQITDGIVVFDREGLLTHNNPAANTMLEINGNDNFDDIFYSYLGESFSQTVDEVTSGTITNVIKLREKYFNIYLAKFSSIKESFLGVICVIQDITEHKKLELMQKEFVANVSHELRTPLTTIKSYAETLLDGAVDEKETAMNFLSVINHESDRMTALVKDLLELSRLDNKQTVFDMKNLDIYGLLEDCISKYKIHAVKKNQELQVDQPDKRYFIFADYHRIEQVINNVISNAVKYSPEGAKIEVSLYKEEKFATIKIGDNGFGIPNEDINRIFERFYRVNKARSREMGGTGLGLAIAKEIVDYHGGKIAVESELDVGTCFYIEFPIVDESELEVI